MSILIFSPLPAYASVDLSTYAQQQTAWYNAQQAKELSGQSTISNPTITPTPTIAIAYTPKSTDDPLQVKLLHQIQNHSFSNSQLFLLYFFLSLPFLPLGWKVRLYYLFAGVPLPPMSPWMIALFMLLSPLITLLLLAILFFTIFGLYRTGLPFILRQFVKKDRERTFLEVTFPSDTAKSAYATQELYKLLHTLARRKSYLENYTKQKKTYALEIVAQKGKGIRYVIQVLKREEDIMKRSLLSYVPGIKVREAEDYLTDDVYADKSIGIAELKLSNHHALPLNKQKVLGEHDPMSYLTGNMTKVQTDDIVAFQVVTTPVLASIHAKVSGSHRNLAYRIRKGEPLSRHLQHNAFVQIVALPVLHEIWLMGKMSLWLTYMTLRFVADGVTALAAGADKSGASMMLMQQRSQPQLILNPYEQELQMLVKEKIDQHLFETTIRVLVAGDNPEDLQIRMEGLLSSFGAMENTYQSLIPKNAVLAQLRKTKITHTRFTQFKDRVLSPNRTFNANPILSASEIADLYHFPYMDTTQTEDLAKLYSPDLPTPLSLKRPEELAMVFAKNTYGGEETLIGLTREERKRHMALFGTTGAGKSTLLLAMLKEDITHGEGFCLIDPHGDLADNVLALIPEERKKDVIWVDPDNLQREIGLNLLEQTEGLNELDTLREQEYIAESIISLFRTVFSDAWTGSGNPHKIEYILRNAIHTSFTIKDSTLFTIYDLLTNKSFRTDVTKKLTNKRLSQFWKDEFTKASSWQQVKMISGVTARIGRFLFSPSANQILDNAKSTINFDEILDTKKIVLCKLPLGELGEDTAQLLGMLILHKLQLAALRRARKRKDERNDYYVYVDEFQNFANLSFMKMLAQTRKYGMNLIAAEQTTAQQKDRTLSNLLIANTGTLIAFKTLSPIDAELLFPQFVPSLKKEDFYNLPAYHFYMKKGAMNPEAPFSGETIETDITPNVTLMEKIIALSNWKYTNEYKKPKENVIEETEEQKKPAMAKRKDIRTRPAKKKE